jgi:alcohol dehydrogenase (cytochrome c)
VVVVATAAVIAVKSSDDVAWRARVIQAKLSGALPELPLTVLVKWLAPGSPVYLAPLAEYPNVHSGIRNLLIDSDSAAKGRQLYGKSCAHCHGENARGGSGSNLLLSLASTTDWAYFSAVKWGRAGTAMLAQPVSDLEIWQIHSFLRQLKLRSDGADEGAPSAKTASINVAPESILVASERSYEWLTYAGNYAGHRHTRLSQISRRNVRDLQVAWIAQLRSADAFLEASPIVAGGLIFVTESPEGVVALDARTGAKVWHYKRPVPANLMLCCSAANRGVAILRDSVFVPTLDAHLVALDASTGRKKWETKVADHRDGYSMTGAPLALNDRVVVGVAGGEFGIRGFVAAFSATDGRLLWKFNTVPGPGEPGHETWANDSWKTGGASTWTTGAYDPKLDLIFWGVGNPAPDFQADSRAGDNLFGNSVIALDAKSGKLRWHFQFIPGGQHDWDAVQQPVLADVSFQGQRRPVVLWANRNGFFYLLDRETGKFLLAKPFVKQTWASGFDPAGRPIIGPEVRPSQTGTLVWPAVSGGTNWWPPSYDERRRLLYVPSVDAASIYFRSQQPRYQKGKLFLGGWAQVATNHPVAASIKAIDVETGDSRWEAGLMRGGSDDVHRVVGGVLSTAGGLVFAGYRDEFFAFDSDDGKKLWQIRLGGLINAAPVGYAINEKQYVALMAGRSLFAFALPPSK